jgi:hypothetical protein
MPSLSGSTTIQIHGAYHAALHLREMVLPEISHDTILKVTGVLDDLPAGVAFDSYQMNLRKLQERLDYIPRGLPGASEFEDYVGEVIKLCFFRSLSNVQSKERSYNGTVVRDWVASNRASGGFWEIIRTRYDATQVIWECKNYDLLHADDFQQAAYYMSHSCGRFVVMVYRAKDLDPSYYRHISRIVNDRQGLVLLLTDKDLKVFVRQALNGKTKEDHISEIFDRTLRSTG